MDIRMTTCVTLLVSACLITTVSSQAILCNFDTAKSGTKLLPCTCGGLSCQLSQVSSDKYDWLAFKGKTPSSPTGPDDDHTQQNNQGLYIYAEASLQNPGYTALVRTPILSLSRQSCLTFWYHMRGQHMGSLEVAASYSNGTTAKIWEESGNKNNSWIMAQMELSDNVNRLSFKAVRGGTDVGMPYGDIGMDDIEVDVCPGVSTTPRSTTSTTTTSTSTTTQTPTSSTSTTTTPRTETSTPTRTSITTSTTTTTPTPTPTSTPTSTTTTSTSTTTSSPSSGQQELWGLDETLWIIILCVLGAVILILLVIVCVQACAMRRMRSARVLRQSEDYSNIEAYNREATLNKDKRDNYINAYDNMGAEIEDKPTAHPNGGGLI